MRPSSAPLFTAGDRIFLQAVVRLGYANPFSPARPEAERVALGAPFVDPSVLPAPQENRRRIASRLLPLLDAARPPLAAAVPANGDDLLLF